MAERLAANAVVEHFEDYELHHMDWFAMALIDRISAAAVMAVMPTTDSRLPSLDERLDGQAAEQPEVLEIDEKLRRVSQLFNAGSSSRRIL